MISVAEILFISAVALMLYAYAGYPLLIAVLSRIFGRPQRRADITPRVSVIIAAHNEERDIAAKLENTLSLDYPKTRLEVIVASDCSTDRTDDIVSAYSERGVILHRQPERLGKSLAQNRAAAIATGEVLVFSDATTKYRRDAVRKIVRSFADPNVGCVAGQLIYVTDADEGIGNACRSYWSYEKFLKRCESRAGSLIGVSGCLYAVRRGSYTRIALDMSSDFVIASEIHCQQLRTVYDDEAISLEETNRHAGDEFRMRVRVIEQTLSAIHRYSHLLNLRRNGLFAFQLISHKVLRYSVPLLLLVAFCSNLILVDESLTYRLCFIAQVAVYGTAFIGALCDRLGFSLGPLSLPYYFVLTNAAALVAFLKFMKGEAHVVWEPLRPGRSSARP